jgi:hypothetical protein
MQSTSMIPQDRLADYFDTFTRRFLQGPSPEAADVEVLDRDLGAQCAVNGGRLLGVTYDRRENALEFEFSTGDHRVYRPSEVWTVENDDGFPETIEVVRPDGVHEIISVKKVGLRRYDA